MSWASDSLTNNKSRATNNERKRSAFTLIELLVVVAIIAVLAAMLLPALENAKWKSRAIRCVSNVRQLMIPLLLYVDDHAGYLPVANPMNLPANGWDYGGWMLQLAPYGRISTTNFTPYLVPTSSMFYCPVPAKGVWAANHDFRWPYAMNHDLRQRGCEDADGTHGVKIGDFREADKTMAFTENGPYADVIHYHFLEYGLFGYPNDPSIATPAHGGKGIPFAFLDGHAEFWARIPPHDEYMANLWDPGTQWPWAHKSFWGNAPSICGWGTTYASLIAPYP